MKWENKRAGIWERLGYEKKKNFPINREAVRDTSESAAWCVQSDWICMHVVFWLRCYLDKRWVCVCDSSLLDEQNPHNTPAQLQLATITITQTAQTHRFGIIWSEVRLTGMFLIKQGEPDAALCKLIWSRPWQRLILDYSCPDWNYPVQVGSLLWTGCRIDVQRTHNWQEKNINFNFIIPSCGIMASLLQYFFTSLRAVHTKNCNFVTPSLYL